PCRIRLDGQEFFVQGELLGQGRTQICVVVGDQDLKCRGHELVLDEVGFLGFNNRWGFTLVPLAVRSCLCPLLLPDRASTVLIETPWFDSQSGRESILGESQSIFNRDTSAARLPNALKGIARIQRVGARPHRKSRASFSGHAPTNRF